MKAGGGFESVCVIPERGQDQLYAVVYRNLGGRAVRTIERLSARVPPVCNERPDLYFTSEPYPIHVLESLTSSADCISAWAWMPPNDNVDAACALASGTLTVTVSYGSYSNYGAVAGALGYEHSGREAEWLECSADCTGGSMAVTVAYGSYYNYGAVAGAAGYEHSGREAEWLDCSADCTGGSMAVTAGYITYSNYAAESLESSCALVSGSLS